MAYAGVAVRPDDDMAGIHACILQRFQELPAKQIIPHAADHCDLRAQPRTLKGLIGALAAGGGVEGLPVNRLSGAGDLLRCGDDIHNKAADNQNAGFLMYHSIAPALQRITASDVLYSYYSGLGKRYKSFLKKPPEND